MKKIYLLPIIMIISIISFFVTACTMHDSPSEIRNKLILDDPVIDSTVECYSSDKVLRSPVTVINEIKLKDFDTTNVVSSDGSDGVIEYYLHINERMYILYYDREVKTYYFGNIFETKRISDLKAFLKKYFLEGYKYDKLITVDWIDNIHNPINGEFVSEVAFNLDKKPKQISQLSFIERYYTICGKKTKEYYRKNCINCDEID